LEKAQTRSLCNKESIIWGSELGEHSACANKTTDHLQDAANVVESRADLREFLVLRHQGPVAIAASTAHDTRTAFSKRGQLARRRTAGKKRMKQHNSQSQLPTIGAAR
jgi:hypothetical protein